MKYVTVEAYFQGRPGGNLDKACRKIFEEHGSKSIGSGIVMAGFAAGERDVQYDVPENKVEEVKAALKQAGFHLHPMIIE